MFTIFPDVPTTRRNRLHHVFDDEDQPRFSSPELDRCIAWLIDQGETECMIQGPSIPKLYTVVMQFGC